MISLLWKTKKKISWFKYRSQELKEWIRHWVFTPIMVKWRRYIMTSIPSILILSKLIFRSFIFPRWSRQAPLLMLKTRCSTWNWSRTCRRCLLLGLPWGQLSLIFGNNGGAKFWGIRMYWARSRSVVTDGRRINSRVRGRWGSVVITDGASKTRTYASAITSICGTTF